VGAAGLRVCAVIPAYNEARHIAQVVTGVRSYLPDVVVVDDGSKDDTAERAAQAGAHVIRHARNRGKGGALQTAFDHAEGRGYDAVIALDADGQHDPGELPRFLAALASGRGDIFLGSRMADPRGMPRLRRWTNRTTSVILSRLARQEIRDSQSGYKAIRMEVLRHVRPTRAGFDAESEFLVTASRRGYGIGHVPIRTIYGDETSSIKPVRDTWRFIRLCLVFLLRLGPGAAPARPVGRGTSHERAALQ
jgi:glycosyltransferase involved in cell wall biosynthesis